MTDDEESRSLSVLVTTRRWLFAWRQSITSMAAFFLQTALGAQEAAHIGNSPSLQAPSEEG
jgi:hypothetical protein